MSSVTSLPRSTMISPVFGSATIRGSPAAHDPLAQGLEQPLLGRLADPDTGRRAAVFLDDDHVLRDVDQTARQVTAVRCTQGGVRETLARAVRGDEVLQHRQPLTEGGADGQLDDAPGRVAHQSAHAGHLRDLADVTLGATDGHDVDAAVLLETPLDHFLHLLSRAAPDIDCLLISLVIRDQTHVVLLFDLGNLLRRRPSGALPSLRARAGRSWRSRFRTASRSGSRCSSSGRPSRP